MKSGGGILAKAYVHYDFCGLVSKCLHTEGISARRNWHVNFKRCFVPEGIKYKCLRDPFVVSI